MPRQRKTVIPMGMRSIFEVLATPRMAVGWLIFAWIGLGQVAIAQPPVTGPDEVIELGLTGHYRVGRWTPIRLRGLGRGGNLGDGENLDGDGNLDGEQPLRLETRDGDGVRVRFTQPDRSSDWAYVIPGSEAVPLRVLRGDETIHVTRFPVAGDPAQTPSMIDRSTPWAVVIGDPLGIDKIGASELLGRSGTVALSLIERAEQLPDASIGLSGIDIMIIGGGGAAVLADLEEPQRVAVSRWLTGGGELFLTLGRQVGQLATAAPWLFDLLPIDPTETVRMDPSALETYTASQDPLQPYVGVRLPRGVGEVLITGRTTRRISVPVAARYVTGLGSVTVVAADLDASQFVAWPQRDDLIERLTEGRFRPDRDETRGNRMTAYDDLAGQMRATLDRYSIGRGFRFSVLSLIVFALILAIGPLDYLLINRVLGRPLLGWLTFPLTAVALSFLLIRQAGVQPSSPTTVVGETAAAGDQPFDLAANRIEIADIDAVDGVGRLRSFIYLYSQQPTKLDLDVDISSTLTPLIQTPVHRLVSTLGYPGETFGGIPISIEDARLPIYDIPVETSVASEAGGLASRLIGLPIPPRSSRGVETRMRFVPGGLATGPLVRRSGSDLLLGGFTNPLPFDVRDGVLVYQNWAYLLPTRLRVGERIRELDELRQKNFRWLLSRQKAIESARETEDWDPTALADPGRLAEVLMFYDAVGGRRYTEMRNVPLRRLDMSHVLVADRCVLFGTVASPLTELAITNRSADDATASDSPAVDQQNTTSLIRVVLPVRNQGEPTSRTTRNEIRR